MREPCDAKVSRTVLRGRRGGNAAPLPGALVVVAGLPVCGVIVSVLPSRFPIASNEYVWLSPSP